MASTIHDAHERRRSIWLFWSLFIHALALVGLWFTPVRQLLIQDSAPPPQPRVTAPQIERIIEQVRQTAADEAREEVQQLIASENVLRFNMQESVEAYKEQVEQWSTEAPRTAMDHLQEVRDAQQQALELAQEAMKQMEQAVQAPDDTAQAELREARQAQNKVSEAQAIAQDAQREIVRALTFLDEHYREVQDAHREAFEAQTAAAEAQDQAREFSERAADLDAQIPRLESLLDRQKNVMELNDNRANDAATALEDHQKSLQELKETLAQAEESKKEQIQKQVERVEQRERVAQENVERYTQRVETTRDEVAKLNTSLERAKLERQEIQQQLTGTQNEAVEAQQNANQKHEEATLKLEETIASKTPVNPASPPEETLTQLEKPDTPLLREMDIADLYEHAVEVEARMTELFRQQRAAENAVAAKIPMDESLTHTQSVAVDRPEINDTLLRTPVNTPAESETHRQEVDKVQAELQDMTATAQRLLGLSSRGQGTEMQVSFAPETASMGNGESSAPQQTDMLHELQQMAAESETERYKNVAPLMRAAVGATPLSPGPRSMDVMAAPSPDLPAARRIATSPTGRSHPGWVYLDSWHIIGPFSNPNRRHIDTIFPPESVIDLDAVYHDDTGRELRWKFQHTPRVALVPRDDEPYAIFYGYTEIWCESDMDVTIAIGSDDYSKVWVNGLMVWASGKQHKAWRPDEGIRTVYMQEGLNRILMRLENGQHGSSMSVMLNLEN